MKNRKLYARDLWQATGLSQRELARVIELKEGDFRVYLNPNNATPCPLLVQLALEMFVLEKAKSEPENMRVRAAEIDSDMLNGFLASNDLY